MSSFDCKQQLRHEIVTNNSWLQNTEEMVQFLIQYFLIGNSKNTISLMQLKLQKLEQIKEENLN